MSDDMDRNILEMPENLITGLSLYQYRNRALSVLAERDALRAENERLRAENEALRADAKRYRWVREPRKGIDVLSRKSGDDRWYYRYGKDLDEYIDSDMARKSER